MFIIDAEYNFVDCDKMVSQKNSRKFWEILGNGLRIRTEKKETNTLTEKNHLLAKTVGI